MGFFTKQERRETSVKHNSFNWWTTGIYLTSAGQIKRSEKGPSQCRTAIWRLRGVPAEGGSFSEVDTAAREGNEGKGRREASYREDWENDKPPSLLEAGLIFVGTYHIAPLYRHLTATLSTVNGIWLQGKPTLSSASKHSRRRNVTVASRLL